MSQQSSILDNKGLGNVIGILKDEIQDNSSLSVISAFFSIFAFKELKNELSKVDNFRLLLPASPENDLFKSNVTGSSLDRRLRNRLDTAYIARSCAKWLERKCSIKQIQSPIGQNLIHIGNDGNDSAIMGEHVEFKPESQASRNAGQAEESTAQDNEEIMDTLKEEVEV